MMGKRNWNEGVYIRTETDYTEEEQSEEFYFSWFHTNSTIKQSVREEEERRSAIKEQIDAGVIHPNGMPVGSMGSVAQPPQPNRKETPYERQQRRKMERKMERKLNKKGQTLIRK